MVTEVSHGKATLADLPLLHGRTGMKHDFLLLPLIAEEVSEGPVVDGRSSPVPSVPGHALPTRPSMGL